MIVFRFHFTHIVDDQFTGFAIDDHDGSQRGIVVLAAVINEIYRVPHFRDAFRTIGEEFLPLAS